MAIDIELLFYSRISPSSLLSLNADKVEILTNLLAIDKVAFSLKNIPSRDTKH